MPLVKFDDGRIPLVAEIQNLAANPYEIVDHRAGHAAVAVAQPGQQVSLPVRLAPGAVLRAALPPGPKLLRVLTTADPAPSAVRPRRWTQCGSMPREVKGNRRGARG